MFRYQTWQNSANFSDGSTSDAGNDSFARLPVCEIYSLSVTEQQPLLAFEYNDDSMYAEAAPPYCTAELSLNRLLDTRDVMIAWLGEEYTAAEFMYYFYIAHTRESLPAWFPEKIKTWRSTRKGILLPFIHPHPFSRRDMAWRFEVNGNALAQQFSRDSFLEIWNTTFRLRSMVLSKSFTDSAENPNTI